MSKAKLYLVKISTEDSEEWEIYATENEEPQKEIKKSMVDEYMYSEEDIIELYPQDSVCGYKVELTNESS